MNFDELFGNDSKNSRYGRGDQPGENNYFQPASPETQPNDIKQFLLNKLRENPKLKTWLIIAAIIVIVALVVAVILLFPLLVKLVDFISKNGVQGLIDSILKGTK